MNLATHPSWGNATAPDGALRITGGATLVDGVFAEADVFVGGGVIEEVGGGRRNGRRLDAAGLFVLPGVIDIHGDGVERLIHPRPSVTVPLPVAIMEADRQFAANGVTTAYHAPTWSWEGGQRGRETVLGLIEGVEALAARLLVDTRIHLRHETFNLDAEAEILDWIEEGRIHALAFNDHMAGTIKQRHRPAKLKGMVERSGLTEEEFGALIDRVYAREGEVKGAIERLAQAAREAGLPMLSHDDMTPAMRAEYRGVGCAIAEFPVTEETARAAHEAGDPIVFGAPNVMRGGSHTGCPSAAEMAAKGLCTVLASDYYYPALPLAPFKLARDGVLALEKAWSLVSTGPARALGLADRGEIRTGQRGDLVLIEDQAGFPPRVVATLVAGRIAYLSDADRLH
jgi:alpha-D-ribose 1-methylphosphonate 5-triphosphate diphosphatase